MPMISAEGSKTWYSHCYKLDFAAANFHIFLNMPYFLSHRKEFTSGGCKWTEGITVSPFLANGRKPEPKKPEPKEERKRKKERKEKNSS